MEKTEQATDRACFHCGEPIPKGLDLHIEVEGTAQPVCCTGCQAVAELILGAGFGRYYRFRQDLARQASEDVERETEAWRGCDERQALWGAEQPDGRRELLLQTEGIRCAACAWLIRSHLENRPEVSSTQVDTATGYTRIVWNPERGRLSELAKALMELGYKPHLPLASAEEQGRQAEKRASMKRLGVAGLGMMQVMMYAVGLYAGDALGIGEAQRTFLEWVSLLVTLPVLFYSGWVFFDGAWRSLVARRPGMDVPVALAIGLAFLASCWNFFRGTGEVWFDSVVMFIFFLSLGRHIEMVLRHRNLQAGAALARLLPEWATRVEQGRQHRVPSIDLAPKDRVWVRAGEAFPADGEILDRATRVDEALLTGESRPVRRAPGDAVIAGTLNLDQPVQVKVTASGAETTVSALGRLLLLAQSRREQGSDLPAWLVPVFIICVLVLAAGTWVGWQWLDPGRAFPAMLSVLVASCPCALSLALPVAYAAASQRLLNEGVLLTDRAGLRMLDQVDTVIFDKTGTLTRGVPEIASVSVNPDRPDCSERFALQVACSLEAASAHPIARAFQAGIDLLPVQSLQVAAGEGVSGSIDGRDWRLGSAAFAEATGALQDPNEVILSDRQGWIARFRLRDSLREGAEETIERLKADGLSLAVLSGDHPDAVDEVADRLGISRRKSRQTPSMKMAELECFRAGGERVLMVGDGVNDAPVLAAADVSMTVKGGAELANSSADLILTSDDLGLVLRARAIARQARRLVRQNLTWAVAYNASVMPLAVSGLLKPWMAALGMSLSSLIVVINASRLVRQAATTTEVAQ
jgi:Cu2+-exporting ATPase